MHGNCLYELPIEMPAELIYSHLQKMKNLPFSKRLRFSINGIRSAFRSESSFRFQVFVATAVFLVLLILQPEPFWWAILSLTIGAVLTAELINTALESALDHLHPDLHESIGKAKDCAAGAVLIASFMSLAVFVAFLFHAISTKFR